MCCILHNELGFIQNHSNSALMLWIMLRFCDVLYKYFLYLLCFMWYESTEGNGGTSLFVPNEIFGRFCSWAFRKGFFSLFKNLCPTYYYKTSIKRFYLTIFVRPSSLMGESFTEVFSYKSAKICARFKKLVINSSLINP